MNSINKLLELLLHLNLKIVSSIQDESNWIWIEFISAYQAERFLGIVSKYDSDKESLYNRIKGEWPKEDNSDFWKYIVKPHDYGSVVAVSNYYKLFISVGFPEKDLESVIENMNSYINEFNKKEEEKVVEIDLNKPLKGTWEELKKNLK
jgi:hypothetical protein